jgi:hypothetical protein
VAATGELLAVGINKVSVMVTYFGLGLSKNELSWQTCQKGSEYNDEAYALHILNNVTILNMST